MRKVAWILVVTVMCSLIGCTPQSPADDSTQQKPVQVVIPDVYDVDEKTAKSILAANTLIPSIKYAYSDDVSEGNVIKTEPLIGTKVDKNCKITLYVSQGPAYIESKNATIEYYLLSDEEDYWEFYKPYIEEGILYIDCVDVTFGCDVTWDDEQNYGILHGTASITDSFDKKIPVTAKYEKQSWKAGESQDFSLEIPLSDLDIDRPTDLYLRLRANDNEIIEVNFFITW